MADTAEVKINSLADLKQQLGIDSLDTKNLELPKPFSLTQEELQKMKADFEKMGNEERVVKLEEIITAKQKILNASKEAREIKPGKPGFVEKMKNMAQELIDWKTLKLTPEIVGELFKSLDHIQEKEFKHSFLVAILTQLNQRWISVNGMEWWKIKLRTWRQNLKKSLDIANNGETVAYESLINNYLLAGKISIIDINTALLYRTSSLDTYLKEKAEWQETSTSDYAERLFKKYNIGFSGPPLKDFKFSADPKEKEDQYGKLKWLIEQIITDNQADKEFLLVYFDDIYYNEKKGLNENAIDEYKKIPGNMKSSFSKLNNLLDPDQKFSLWILSENQAEQLKTEWKNDPKKAFIDAFNKWWWILGFLFAIIWGFMWWKGWMFAGAGLWFGLGWWWDVFAWELIEKAGKGKWWNWESNIEVLKKYENLFTQDIWGLKKENLNSATEKLLWNTKFLESESKKLNIFIDGTKPEDIEKYFKSIQIWLDDKNKPYFKEIFKTLLEKRKANWITEPIEWETVNEYLLKTTNIQKAEKPEVKNNKALKEQISELQIEWKDVIIALFKSNRYWNLKIETIEKLYNNPAQLEGTFKAYGQIDFFNKYKSWITEILKRVIENEGDKTKTLKEVLS